MCDKFMKQISHFRGGTVHAFGMPLDAESKGMVLNFNCLDCSVLSPGAYRYAFSGLVHSLMVEAVHIEAGSGTFFQPASPLDPYPVADFAAAGRLLHMV